MKKNFFKVLTSLLLVMVLALPSTQAFAEDYQFIETPEIVRESMLELQQTNDTGVFYHSPISTYATGPDITPLTAYRDKRFKGRSAPEFVVLQDRCDSISMWGICTEEGVTDDLVLHIEDNTYDGLYSAILPFVADDSITTVALGLPPGRYTVYVVGDLTVQKADCIITFFNVDTSIL